MHDPHGSTPTSLEYFRRSTAVPVKYRYDPPTGSPPSSAVYPIDPLPPPPLSVHSAIHAGACSAPRRDDRPRSLPLRPLTKLLPRLAARPVGASCSRCWRSWWCSWERTHTCTTLAGLGRSVCHVQRYRFKWNNATFLARGTSHKPQSE